MKALLSVKDFWDTPQPMLTYVDSKRDKLASLVILKTIADPLKDITDTTNTAYEAMQALQRHFRRGGRTNQFALFSQLIHLQLDLNETEMLARMSEINAIVAESASTGFTSTSDSIRGLFSQLHMPTEMTKQINKELDNKFYNKNPNFNLNNIKSEIQIYLAREKIGNKTINTQQDNISINSASCKSHSNHQFPSHNQSDTPLRFNYYSSQKYSSPNRNSHSEEAFKARWQRGPMRWTKEDTEQTVRNNNPIKVPTLAIQPIKLGIMQCFFCGNFGHSYRFGNCMRFETGEDISGGEHVTIAGDWEWDGNGNGLLALYGPTVYNPTGVQKHKETKSDFIDQIVTSLLRCPYCPSPLL
ncbi:hypothetical protein DFH28DRAFT_1124467 [Melampsora americana]|nr:hypothetical protein DFH28DRAFT_1124467 [Melampsora americana]